MHIRNVTEESSWFDVLLTGKRSQAAVMRLDPGGASSPAPLSNEGSDQVLLVLEGLVEVELQGETRLMRRGDMLLVPDGTPVRVVNAGDVEAVTFNVYGPPAYPTTEQVESLATSPSH
ncbi:cupin domain-containing protein [Myxococcaceae bacterium JPH2]|nr:cupin domain-containing protein [Myxococcaceae bacterium JPH2]